MHLVHFDLNNQTYQVICSTDTTYEGQKCETDLLAIDDHGNIIATNFNQNTCSLYTYTHDKIVHTRDLSYNAGNRVHGLRFVNASTVAVTCRLDQSGVHFFDINTCKQVALYKTTDTSIQDLCLLPRDVFAMISGDGTPLLRPDLIYSSCLSLIKYNLKQNQFNRTIQKEFPASHFDNIIHYNNTLYITDQYNNRVVRVDAQTLQDVGDLTGYNFPHGIDVNYGMIAVTNYGNNTIIIKHLNFK
jgi:WD40 repeat protein